jgi:hypothetical protein
MRHSPNQDVAIRRLIRQGATVRRVMVGYPSGPCVRSYTVSVVIEREDTE